MLESIALLAPSLVALRFYHHLRGNKLTIGALIMSYGIFVVFINALLYMVLLYILGFDKILFSGKFFVGYLLAASALAFVVPFIVTMLETTVSVKVNKR